MSNKPHTYGLDRDIQKKLESKYSIEREQQVRKWISSIIDDELSDKEDLHTCLKDGVVLQVSEFKMGSFDYLRTQYSSYNRLISKLAPGYGRYKKSNMPFVQMENISKFLLGASSLDVPTFDLFQTVDLYENKNMTQVLNALFSISRYACKARTSKIFLGPKLAERHYISFSEEKLNASKSVYNTNQYGFYKGASQSSIRFGARREIGETV